jgi:predicted unusual protein kinase regulating ubiquinone biosynthesis (AarF/ABC1/UbiB family)
VEELVRRDLAAARPIMRWLERWLPNTHVRNARAVVEEFAVRIWEEMDFVHEAANAEEIRRNFRGHARVVVPRVVHELVRRRVLALEYLAGTRVDRLTPRPADRNGGPDPRGVVSTVMELYLRMMLVHGFFHADPHPGNLLVTADGRVVLLDFGMVVRVPRELRWHLVSTVFAAIRRDVDGIVAGFEQLGVIEPGADPVRIRELAARLMAIAYDPSSMQERIQLLADEVMATLYDWPVRLPSELVYFARTTTLIEGLGVRYDRHFNPILFATPIAMRMRREILQSLGRIDGQPPPLDLATVLGTALGRVAREVVRAGTAFLSRIQGLTEMGPPTPEPLALPPPVEVPKLLAGD